MNDSAEDIRVTNFSNIFISCSTNGNCQCRYKVHEHMLIYVRSGEVEIDDRGRQTIVKPGQCAFIRRHAGVHMTKRSVSDDDPYMSITLSFPRKFLMQFYRNIDKSTLPDKASRCDENLIVMPERPDLRSLFESLMPFFDSTVEPDCQWINMKLTEGLYAILRTDKNLYASLFDFTEPWKIDILDYLNENYMYEMSIQDIAHYTGRSLATFKRDFKKISDTTPQKWIINRRLQRAHELLAHGTSRVSDVMADVGFTNLSYFSRIYKDAYGHSPTERA